MLCSLNTRFFCFVCGESCFDSFVCKSQVRPRNSKIWLSNPVIQCIRTSLCLCRFPKLLDNAAVLPTAARTLTVSKSPPVTWIIPVSCGSGLYIRYFEGNYYYHCCEEVRLYLYETETAERLIGYHRRRCMTLWRNAGMVLTRKNRRPRKTSCSTNTCVHQKFHMYCPGRESGPLQWEAGN
jgi:hypothetical protein